MDYQAGQLYFCTKLDTQKVGKPTCVRSRHWVHEASLTLLVHPGCFHFEWFTGATCQVVSIASVTICHTYMVAKLFDAVCGSICVGRQILRENLEVRTCMNDVFSVQNICPSLLFLYFYIRSKKMKQRHQAMTYITDLVLLQYFTDISNACFDIKMNETKWRYS